MVYVFFWFNTLLQFAITTLICSGFTGLWSGEVLWFRGDDFATGDRTDESSDVSDHDENEKELSKSPELRFGRPHR